MKALILTAGKGTRLGLKKTPKCMVKVNKKPVLEHLVNHLNKHGITEIVINISSHADYTKIFKYFGTRLLYFYEPVLMGEHGTEQALKNWLGDEYVVMNGDTLTNVDIEEMRSWKATSVKFCKNGRYAGTKIVRPNIKFDTLVVISDYPEWYYYDIGTPAKLAKARRELKGK